MSRAIASGETQGSMYLWGQRATGKSHLLQAICNYANQSGLSSAYIPLKKYAGLGPGMLNDLENLSIICIDDLDLIEGQHEWELALFCLYNRAKEQNRSLLTTANRGLRSLVLKLPDLQSRIAADLIYHLQPLGDMDKINLLQQRADIKNFTMPASVATYLVRHVKRDLPSLLDLLDKFERSTLAENRKLTIPFVQSLIREKI